MLDAGASRSADARRVARSGEASTRVNDALGGDFSARSNADIAKVADHEL
jgi:hypothetical protein